MQKIISWNVASVRARMPLLSKFLKREQPDVVFLQEIKATEDVFPFFDFQVLGYQAIISGQKSYNGVAILSKHPLQNIKVSLDGFEDQARFIEAETKDGIKLISVYVPNGNPPEKDPSDTSKLEYKLRWFEAFKKRLDELIRDGKDLILGGDFNVIEKDTDVYNPENFRESALMVDSVRKAYQAITNLPIQNMIRKFNSEPHTYSFWDFQGGAWPRNHGILLDALFVTNGVAKDVKTAHIYKDIRGLTGTSDHAPIGIEL